MYFDLEPYKENLEVARNIYNQEIGVRNKLQSDLESYILEADNLRNDHSVKTQITALLQSLSELSREKAKMFLQDIVTTAIKYISEEDYEFEIEFTEKANKPFAEFYIVETIGKHRSKQKPEDACGGGFVDVIASSLRYAYLEILQTPIIQGSLILDEPGKMISENAAIKYGDFTNQLTHSFDRQTIMVTHNAALMNVADKTYVVTKNNSQSVVQIPQSLNVLLTQSDIDLFDELEV